MNALKIKKVTPKFEELFGHIGPKVEYTYADGILNIEDKVVATVERIAYTPEGFDPVFKIYNYSVNCTSHNVQVTCEWTEDWGITWVIQKLVSKLTSEPRVARTSSGLNAEQRALLASERKRYLASKNKLTKKDTDEMGGEVIVKKSKK